MPNGTTTAASKRLSTENIEVPTLNILSSSATEEDRIQFIRRHLDAMALCGRRSLQHAWLVGRELDWLKEKRVDLRGDAWLRFIRTEFKLGERQSYDLLRLHRGLPSIRSVPKGIESIRGAIHWLQAEAEAKDAERRGPSGRSASASDDGAPQWECDDDTSDENDVASASGATQTYEPLAALPSSPRIREELRMLQQKLVQLAKADKAAFNRVKQFVTQQHARVCTGKPSGAKR